MSAPFHDSVRQLFDNIRRANFVPLHQLPVAAARATYSNAVGAMSVGPAPVAHVQELQLPLPDGPRAARLWDDQPGVERPVLLYLHGGGFVVGGLSTCDALCRQLARQSGAAVLALDYRKCPEHRVADSLADTWHALQWLHRHGHTLGLNGQRLAIGGDSAGGLLAATTALRARDAGVPLALQMLIYPSVQTRMETESFRAFADHGLLDRRLMDWFARHNQLGQLEAHWHREPLFAPDHRGLAPAWIGLAECDVVTDEGVAYADRLRAAGVPVTLRVWDGMVHDFINMGRFLPAAQEAHSDMAQALATALGTRR